MADEYMVTPQDIEAQKAKNATLRSVLEQLDVAEQIGSDVKESKERVKEALTLGERYVDKWSDFLTKKGISVPK